MQGGGRLDRLVERTKPAAEKAATSAAAQTGFGQAKSSRPRITGHSLTEQERVWCEILSRRF
jgi:hypothetical protein